MSKLRHGLGYLVPSGPPLSRYFLWIASVRSTPVILANVVIQASTEEAAAHDAMLEKIRESGACVWDFD